MGKFIKEGAIQVFSQNEDAKAIYEDEFWHDLMVAGNEIHQLARTMRSDEQVGELQPFLFLFLRKNERERMIGPIVHQFPDGTITAALDVMLNDSHGIVTVMEAWMKCVDFRINSSKSIDLTKYDGKLRKTTGSVEVIVTMIHFGNGCDRRLSKSIMMSSEIENGQVSETMVIVSKVVGRKVPTPVEVQ